MPQSLAVPFEAMDAAVAAGGIDLNNPANHERFRRAGRRWKQTLPVPRLVKDLWGKFVAAGAEPLHHLPLSDEAFPKWWTFALALMIIADEACDGLGYAPAYDFKENWMAALIMRAFWRKNERALQAIKGIRRTATLYEDLPSMCFLADPDVVCVQPKVRTPAVGCTLRSYTHNVALLPPRGIVSTGWQHPPGALLADESSALNLLIVPYPFNLSAKWFSGIDVNRNSANDRPNDVAWGWFHLEQKWLERKVIDFTEALIAEAEKDVGTIHGLLFPEYALDWPTFELVKDMILTKFPRLEFLVSGTSSNCVNETGNFVLSAVFFDQQTAKNKFERTALVSSRWKHHRWRLDEPQISNYALGSALDPRVLWWEAIALGPREIDFTVFRTASAFTTLICEDLARSDPCHGVLRDVGPNLVFVMLMDGPQLASRWAARYSTTLADDPGCSVLTYTSLGLVERSNRSGKHAESRVIGLWKDDTGHAIEISCPEGAHGVVLTLSDARVREKTLDGRADNKAWAWRFHSSSPVTAKPTSKKLRLAISAVMSSNNTPPSSKNAKRSKRAAA